MLLRVVVVLAEVVFGDGQMTITDYEAFVLITVVACHLIILVLVSLLLLEIFAILLGPFVFRIHVVINTILVAAEWIPRRYDVALLVKGPLEVLEAILDDNALALGRSLDLLAGRRAATLLLRSNKFNSFNFPLKLKCLLLL